jgi:signal transduction histidine kinase/predicted membrane channel-forming protein YqfA (hemolysin III family)
LYREPPIEVYRHRQSTSVVLSLSPAIVYLLYVGAFALAALGCFGSTARLGRISDPNTRRGMLALLLTSGGWATAHVGVLVSPTAPLKRGWYVLGLILGLAAVGAWLYVCSAYTNRTYHHDPRFRRLAAGGFIVFVATKLTNPFHHGYFTTTSVATPFPHLSFATGPLHWVAMGLSYALVAVGYFVLLELFTEIDLDTRPLLVLVGITGLPLVADLVGHTTPVLIDMTYEPLGVAVFAVGVAFVYLDRFDAVQLAADRDTPVITLDADGHVRDANRAARTLFPALETARGASLEATLPRVAERLDSDDPILELEQAGETRYFRLTETPYGTPNTGLGRTLTVTDATEHEQYQRRLNALHETTRKLMTARTHAAITTRASEAASQVLGLHLNGVHLYDEGADGLVPVAWSSEADDLIGDPPTFTPADGSAAWQVFETGAARIRDDVRAADDVYDPDTAIRSEIVLPLGSHGVFLVGDTTKGAFDRTDITLAKILAANVEAALTRADREQELRAREAKLARRNEQLDEFMSALAHDLRNPLNVAIGRLEFLEEDVEDEHGHIEVIRRAHDRASALVDDILRLARQGERVGETAPVSVSRIATRAWEQMTAETATLEVETDSELEADASRLQQLFENLFRNAIDHGGEDVTIRVGSLGDGAGFYVADDGPGIAPTERDRVFERGYSTAASGTGFGLAIVEQIVDAHGWTLTIGDSAHGGARVEVHTTTDT